MLILNLLKVMMAVNGTFVQWMDKTESNIEVEVNEEDVDRMHQKYKNLD